MTKDQHRWSEEIGGIEFIFTDRGSYGRVVWQHRKELLLKAGARLTPDPQLNKDGSLNYSARFAKALRTDHAEKIVDGVTRQDIIFPSPNELGIFLRFGGDNTWVSLKDQNGKSLHEWSKY